MGKAAMNLIVLLDIFSTLGFGAALFFVSRIKKDNIYHQARYLLYVLMGIYFFVGITNIMEHTGFTAFFDQYEEYLEIVFTPFFLFFLYSMIAKLNLDKRQEDEDALKKALNRAESEKSKSNAIIAAIGDGISIQDTNLLILYQNDKHKQMAGNHVGEFCYQAYEHNDEPCEGCPLVASFNDGKVHKAERTGPPTDKGQLYVEITASPLIDQDGHIYGGIEVVRDITARKKMTEEVLRAQKLESIGLLAGGIAHDFNNLLTALLGNISLAKTYAGTDTKVVQKLAAAEKASMRAKDLTQQLLTFSKGGAPVKKVMHIKDLVTDSCSFALRGANVNCTYEFQEDLWPVDVDAGQLNQVIHNLVINADQAMPEGGIVNIKTENVVFDKTNPLRLNAGNYVRISVADQGVGIDQQDLPRIFDPFYTNKPGGSGLGLATAFSIIKNHQGHITVESTPGKGATFLVYIPAAGKAAVESLSDDNITYSGHGHILIMDDIEEVREIAAGILSHAGYSVALASSGAEAVTMYRQALEKNAPYDAVILDLTIPGGMGGKEAAQNILALDPDAKIIVSSGYANDPIMADYANFGFSGMVPKPYKIQDLSKVVYDVLQA
jgi:signal transduction histidine kinase/ActR/RegA family two-component response regulator